MRPITRLSVYLMVLCLAVAMSACGDDADDGDAQPAEDSPTFVEGDFGEVPVHPLADPVGERSTTGDVTAQSFEVRNLTRDQLFEWYDENLDGWTSETTPGPVGEAPEASWRGTWTSGDRRLIVTASEGTTLSGSSSSDDVRLQYSLSLEPADRPLPTQDAPGG